MCNLGKGSRPRSCPAPPALRAQLLPNVPPPGKPPPVRFPFLPHSSRGAVLAHCLQRQGQGPPHPTHPPTPVPAGRLIQGSPQKNFPGVPERCFSFPIQLVPTVWVPNKAVPWTSEPRGAELGGSRECQALCAPKGCQGGSRAAQQQIRPFWLWKNELGCLFLLSAAASPFSSSLPSPPPPHFGWFITHGLLMNGSRCFTAHPTYRTSPQAHPSTDSSAAGHRHHPSSSKREDKKGFVGGWLGLPGVLPAGPADAIAGCAGLWPNKVTETKIVPLLETRRMCQSSGEGGGGRERRQEGARPSGIKAASATLRGLAGWRRGSPQWGRVRSNIIHGTSLIVRGGCR